MKATHSYVGPNPWVGPASPRNRAAPWTAHLAGSQGHRVATSDLVRVVPRSPQVLTRDPRLTLKGCERLLCVLSTCNGDDFAVWTAGSGSLRLVFDLLCRMDADPALVRDATAAGGKGGFALYQSLQQTFVQVRGALTFDECQLHC